MFTLPVRKNLVHKAIEPKNLSAATLAEVQARADDLWEVKYDGCHAVLVKAAGIAYGFSRPGEVVAGAMDRQLRAMESEPSDNYVMFAEAWHAHAIHSTLNGDFRRGYADDEERTLKAVVFDIVPLSEFLSGVGTQPFLDRTSTVSRFVCALEDHGFGDLFEAAAQFATKAEAVEYVANKQDSGLVFAIDGFMRKARNGLWKAGAGSCGTIVKDKAKFTVDIKVDKLIEGKGKFAGMLGAYECTYKGQKQLVGGGKLTNKERQHIWDNPTTPKGGVGSIIEVHGLGESTNGLIREPRFFRFRPDKTEGE